jgi:hypothetical protein
LQPGTQPFQKYFSFLYWQRKQAVIQQAFDDDEEICVHSSLPAFLAILQIRVARNAKAFCSGGGRVSKCSRLKSFNLLGYKLVRSLFHLAFIASKNLNRKK